MFPVGLFACISAKSMIQYKHQVRINNNWGDGSMTTDEKLDSILNNIAKLSTTVNGINTRLENLESSVYHNSEIVESSLSSVNKLENTVDLHSETISSIQNDVSKYADIIYSLKSEVADLESSIKHNTVVTEEVISKCIDVMYDGFKLNADKFDKIDFNAIKHNSEVAILMAKSVNERIESCIK